MRKTLSRTIRTNPNLARLFILTLSVTSFLSGIFFHIYWTHSRILLSRAIDTHVSRYTSTSLTFPPPIPRDVTLISTLYTGSYPPSRLTELRLVILRNLHLSTITNYQLITEDNAALPSPFQSLNTTKLHTITHPPSAPITYETLFTVANRQPAKSLAIIANADIYFDESLSCAVLLAPNTLLALSRHPSPDCAPSSSYGDTSWEPQNFCFAYDPIRAASHDVFIFTPPVPQSLVSALANIPVNRLGAENVVIHQFLRHGYRVLNPCANIHAFHQHCDKNTRARSATKEAGSISLQSGQFAGAQQWGYIDPVLWVDEKFIGNGVQPGLDCLSYGRSTRVSG